jgi:hypothetical protein
MDNSWGHRAWFDPTGRAYVLRKAFGSRCRVARKESLAVGPGRRGKEWGGDDGHHFVFEQNDPVQT